MQMQATDYKDSGLIAYKWISRIAVLLVITWLTLIAGKLMYYEVHAAPSFDGAMNFEVARSLSQGDGYRRLYQNREPFPHEIQTKGPLILPTALVYYFFGVGIAQSSIINIVYFLLLLGTSFILARSIGASLLGSLLAAITVFSVPGIVRFGFGGYGEIPALAWIFIATAYYYRRPNLPDTKKAFFTGLLLAMAYLTKTVMLIGVAGFGLVFIIQLIWHRREYKSASIRDLGFMAAGFMAPITSWEIWKAISLGGWHAWLNWWSIELRHISKQAGIKALDAHASESFVQKSIKHLHTLSSYYQIPYWMTASWILLILIATGYILVRSTRDQRVLAVSVVLSIASIYFIWWIGMTIDNRTWLRRIIAGMICGNLGILLALHYILSKMKPEKNFARFILIGLALFVPVTLLAKTSESLYEVKLPDNTKLLETVNRVKNLPSDAYIFSIGWWSSPRVALLSGRHILNFNQTPVLSLSNNRQAYVIKEPVASYIRMINHAFSMYGLHVPQDLNFDLYRIPQFKPRSIKISNAPVKSEVTENESYPYMEGFYAPVKAFGFWLSSDNIILLDHQQSETLYINGYAEAQSQYLHPSNPHLYVSFNGCKAQPVTVPNNLVFTIHIDIPRTCRDISSGPVLVRIQVDNLVNINKAGGDFRALSILAKRIGFGKARSTSTQQ